MIQQVNKTKSLDTSNNVTKDLKTSFELTLLLC